MFCIPDVRVTCRTVPGLNKDQLELCYKASDVTVAALEGLELAVKECQVQVSIISTSPPTHPHHWVINNKKGRAQCLMLIKKFQWHRWNCSSLSTKSRNPHSSNLLKKGN